MPEQPGKKHTEGCVQNVFMTHSMKTLLQTVSAGKHADALTRHILLAQLQLKNKINMNRVTKTTNPMTTCRLASKTTIPMFIRIRGRVNAGFGVFHVETER